RRCDPRTAAIGRSHCLGRLLGCSACDVPAPLPRAPVEQLAPVSSTRRKAPALVIALAAVFALAAVPAFADPTVASKQAEAQSVLGQVQKLDSSLERAVEAYNLANVELARTRS